MPEKKTIRRSQKAKREGKAPSTQAGEFVREEMEHIRKGKHGARSTKQAIAIGLSKARRAGVDLKPPAEGKVSEKSRKSAQSAYEKGQKRQPVSKKRSAAGKKALKKEPRSTASSTSISQQVRSSAKKRTAHDKSTAAKKGARTRAKSSSSSTAKARPARSSTKRTVSKKSTATKKVATTKAKRSVAAKKGINKRRKAHA